MPALKRDCPATAIPSGDQATLHKGDEIQISQTLGGNVTVRTDHGLFRIAGEHADAIEGFKFEPADMPAEALAKAGAAPKEGVFDEKAVWDALRTCFDPEIPVNIVDLGLVYDLAIEPTPAGGNIVDVKMTLTAQGCGMGPAIAEDARRKIVALPTVETARVHIVWDPVWTPQMISPAGRMALGLE